MTREGMDGGNGQAMNETACQFLKPRTLRPPLCSLKRDASERNPEAPCGIGLPKRCPWPELRESEIRRLERANRASEAPVSMLVRMARKASGE